MSQSDNTKTSLADLTSRCDSTIEHFKKELAKTRGSRASSGMIDNLQVDYYGSHVPIKQLAVINTPEPRLITIQPYDAQAVAGIEKAIIQSDLGLMPSRDGTLIRINIPPLTEARRKELVKIVNKMAEEAKVIVRSHRRDEIDNLKGQQKKGLLSEDELYRTQEKIQTVVDKYVKQIDDLLAHKEKEMLEI
jgi:ribosome recycling factor